MNFWRNATKVFAFLLFVNSAFVYAQNDSSIYNLPVGTKIRVRMDNEINSKVSSVNDTFTMTTSKPVLIREVVVLPAGTVIEGRVIKVKRAAYGGKNGSLSLSFETMRLANGVRREIEGVLSNPLETASSSTANILTVAGGTALGALIGSASKAENGALIGAGIGTGAGLSVAFLRKGKNVRIKTDEEFEIELTRNVPLPVQDY